MSDYMASNDKMVTTRILRSFYGDKAQSSLNLDSVCRYAVNFTLPPP
jgi:hypothetical protein